MSIRTTFNPFLTVILLALFSTTLSAQETPAAPQWMMPWGSSAMQRSMDPQIYDTMFKMIGQNPSIMTDPAPLCAQCHDGEAMARYQKTLFPAYQLMMNPMNWMNPNAYMQAMTPMMDPQTYTEWYNAMIKMMNPGPQYGNQNQ